MTVKREGWSRMTTVLAVGLALAVICFMVVARRSLQVSEIPPGTSSGTTDVPAPPAAPGGAIAAPASPVSMTPSSGPVGTAVTVAGSGFGPTSTVKINGLVSASLKNIISTDGKKITFKIPPTLGPDCVARQACPQFLLEVAPGPYSITVASNGGALNAGIFTVTKGLTH